jgi:hypothetical protein
LVGEGAYLAGRAARPVYEAGQAVGATPAKLNTLADLLNAQQQAQNNELFNIQQMVPQK